MSENAIQITTTENDTNKNDNNDNDNNKNDNDNNKNKNKNIIPQISLFSIMSGNIFNSTGCNKVTDGILIIFSVGGIIFGVIAWFTINTITAFGYIFAGLFSGISLFSIRRMRLRATLQTSVNSLKEENDELKENNDELHENIDELEENIDELETVSQTLHKDLSLLKETIGIFGDNSDQIINNLRDIYDKLKAENEIHSTLNKNTIYLHILHIIKHFDKKCQFVLTSIDLENAKNTLLNAFPNLDYEALKNKIIDNKITADRICETILL